MDPKFIEIDQRQFQHHFRSLDGLIRHEQRISQEQAEAIKNNHKVEYLELVQVIANGRSESMVSRLNKPNIVNGTINSPEGSSIPESSLDVLLGIRIPKHGEPIDQGSLSNSIYEFTPPDLEGRSFLKATFHDGERQHVWYFDPSLGYAVSRYHQLNPKTGKINRRIYVEKHDLEKGIPMPVTIVDEVVSHAYGQEAVIVKNEMYVESYQFNAPDNTLDSYPINWPKGTVVSDLRTGLVFRAGDVSFAEKEIVDEMIRRIDSEDGASGPMRSSDAQTIGDGSEDPIFGIESSNVIARAEPESSKISKIFGALLFALSVVFFGWWWFGWRKRTA